MRRPASKWGCLRNEAPRRTQGAMKGDRPMTNHSKSLPKTKPATTSATATNKAKPATTSATATNKAYLGLVPRQDDSGDRSSQLRITKAGDPYLRLLVGSAQYIVGPFGLDTDLRP